MSARGNAEATGSDACIIALDGIEKTFGTNVVLKGVTLSARSHEVVGIIGSSGGGKSTCLRCINLLELPSAGTVSICGEQVFSPRTKLKSAELTKMRQKVGMVFQEFRLFPHLTAIENIALPMKHAMGLDENKAIDRAAILLETVGLRRKALSYPERMSGGEQQRTAIARALGLQPVALLFDEPTSALDPESTIEVNNVMRSLAAEGMTMVVVTHELGFAERVCDRLVFIDDGVIVEQGPPAEVLHNPRESRTQKFVASFRR